MRFNFNYLKFNYLSKGKISLLPKKSGVYAFFDRKNVLYIGKAKNIRERIKNHFFQPSFQDNLFIDKVKRVGYLVTNSEIEALILESKLIKKYQPKFNILWRDDKNYFYLAKTKEDFPRIFITHQPKKDNLDYIGPFVEGRALKTALNSLRRVFPFRSCKKFPKRACLWYQLDRCLAPCLIKSESFSLKAKEIKKESKRNAKNLFLVFQGKKRKVLKDLEKEMKKYAKKEEFEKAAKIRDQIEALKRVLSHSFIFFLPKSFSWSEIEEKIKEILGKKEKIERIEGYDVSNIQGKEATGSLVCFIKGKKAPKWYRRFKIKTKGPNDPEMIKEVLLRRAKHSEWPEPDLVIIDGGKAQLNFALKAKKRNFFKKTKFLAVAKGKKELFIEGQKKAISLNNLSQSVSNFLLEVITQAHKFGIFYHRKLREKKILKE